MSKLPSQVEKESLAEYIDECVDKLERFSKSLSQIEGGFISLDLIAGIYRDIHTIKGNSQFFGFSQIGVLAHAMETCLEPFRTGKAQVNTLLIDSLFNGVDFISSLLAGIRQDSKEPDLHKQVGELVLRLVSLTPSVTEEESKKANQQPIEAKSTTVPPTETNAKENQSLSPVDTETGNMESSAAFEHPGFEIFDDLPIEQNKVASTPPAPSEPREVADIVSHDSQRNDQELTAKASDTVPSNSGEEGQSESIRVQVELLDNLMNLVGELVLIRNQLLQHAKVNDSDAEFVNMSQRLNILTAELQNEVMKTRMQPMGNVLNKFNRVVREMGRELGKKIDLSIFGSDTELDKTIIEAVKDPLTHIVRNSIDHGIELPSDRRSLGKPETGHLMIRAHHESGQVIIEVTDDGRGLDRNVIGSNAIKKGLVSAEALSKMTDREVQHLVFLPGFSTASSVSSMSGRGVGMDVVKTNIERIGGMVDLSSKPGSSTAVKLKIPLTLAIVPALIIRALGQRFAIPQVKLVELVRIDANDMTSEKIETLQGSPVLRLRGKILPLLSLSAVLTNPQSKIAKNLSPIQDNESINVVILNADTFQFGLIVDAVEDTADIVVKSLSPFLKELSHFSGATIMGDGSVALTIDVLGISSAVRPNLEAGPTKSMGLDVIHDKKKHHQMDISEFLLIDVGAPGSYAIPLTVVSRLEEFNEDEFELSGEQKVIKYGESLLPIFSLPEFLQLPFSKKPSQDKKIPVVVIRRGENLYGIEVFQIQDVAAMSARIDQTVRDRPGILGTMVANDAVLVVVDIFGMIDAVKSKLAAEAGYSADSRAVFDDQNEKDHQYKRRKYRILLVEDSSFFRSYIRQIIEESGYQVLTACDGLEGWNILEGQSNQHFSLVISDIEMPSMDGLQLARKISEDNKYKNLLLIAVTTRFSSADRQRGLEAGFTRYLEKLNAEKLIAEMDELLLANSRKPELGKELKLANSH